MSRETKKITLPQTQGEVEIYTYITGGEKRQINEILTASLSADTSGVAKGEIALSVVFKANDKALELLVVGYTDELKDLPANDYDYLLEEVNKITNDTSFSQKKTT